MKEGGELQYTNIFKTTHIYEEQINVNKLIINKTRIKRLLKLYHNDLFHSLLTKSEERMFIMLILIECNMNIL